MGFERSGVFDLSKIIYCNASLGCALHDRLTWHGSGFRSSRWIAVGSCLGRPPLFHILDDWHVGAGIRWRSRLGNLSCCSFLVLGDEANNSFSAMRLDTYKHFLRMKIEQDKITIYPIGIDRSPRRRDWKLNRERVDGDQDAPVIVPKKDLKQRLIDGPIEIDMSKAVNV